MTWITAARYGPVSVLALWQAQYEEAIYLVTNMVDVDSAFALYRKRAHIETFFSDIKSRGFGIHKSHLSEPTRVGRLVMAACLTYIWLVYLGVCAGKGQWMKRLHPSLGYILCCVAIVVHVHGHKEGPSLLPVR